MDRWGQVVAPDVLLHVMGFLGERDIFTCALVSRLWNQVAYDVSLWEPEFTVPRPGQAPPSSRPPFPPAPPYG